MADYGRVCVYTAICGGYDRLKAQPAQSIDCDWLCFTDTPTEQVSNWRIANISYPPDESSSSRMRAKHFKVLSHQVFPGGWFDIESGVFGSTHYDHIIWIDGSVQILRPDLVELMLSSIGDAGWAMFSHPQRNCVYAEAEESAPMVKYRGMKIVEQAAAYRRVGYPVGRGLWSGGLIARRTDAHHLAAINDLWWRENMQWTIQDQISLPVVMWRLGLAVNTVPVPFVNDYFGLDAGHRMGEYQKTTSPQIIRHTMQPIVHPLTNRR